MDIGYENFTIHGYL